MPPIPDRSRSAEPDDISQEEVDEWFDEEEEEDSDDEPSITIKESPSTDEKYARTQIQIVRSSIDFTLHTLRQSLQDSSYINLSPDYQRRTRWDRKRRSLLIESFLMNIPIPPIFLFENEYNTYEAMDGRQRLETIRDFLDNKFSLIGLEFYPELKGRRFSELSATMQRGLLRRSITAIVLLAETTHLADTEHDVRMILFRRLNTGGARLNPQEMRNALYPGAFNTMLARVARTEPFTRIWRIPSKADDEELTPPPELGRNVLYRTMADCELVLRVFAIQETMEGTLKGSMRRILDKCMRRHAGESAAAVNRMEEQFQRCLQTLDKAFDGRPFLLPSTKRPSRNLYDAMMVALSCRPAGTKAIDSNGIKTRLTNALGNAASYAVLTGHGNTVERIKQRVAIAENILFDGAM